MEAKATARYVRVAPRKARVVADLVRGKYVDEALELLRFANRRAAGPVWKVLKSAVANAQNKFDAATEELLVKEIMVDKGPTLKRWRPRARGMATRINKMTTHITVVVAEHE
jgi:large subunit ribosomal protein L22